MSVFVVVEIAGGKRLLGLAFRKSQVTLGRSPESDVCLPDPSVLERHATLKKRGNAYLIFAESPDAPPFVTSPALDHGAPLDVDSPVGFDDGASLDLGRVRLRLFATRPENASIEWTDGAELERRIVECSLAESGLPHSRRDVTRALRELRSESFEAPQAATRKERPWTPPATPSLERDRALAWGLGLALLLVFAALYWLFRADTPRSL